MLLKRHSLKSSVYLGIRWMDWEVVGGWSRQGKTHNNPPCPVLWVTVCVYVSSGSGKWQLPGDVRWRPGRRLCSHSERRGKQLQHQVAAHHGPETGLHQDHNLQHLCHCENNPSLPSAQWCCVLFCYCCLRYLLTNISTNMIIPSLLSSPFAFVLLSHLVQSQQDRHRTWLHHLRPFHGDHNQQWSC